MANVGTFSRKYNTSKSENVNYLVTIRCAALDVEIIADMPEETATAVGSEWEGLLPASLGSVPILGNIVEAGSKLVGGSGAVLQYNTQQIWVNSSPMEIPLTLQFDAKEDAFRDVYAPMRLLEMMALPNAAFSSDYNTTMLYSPGTNRGAAFGGDSTISLHIGKHLNIPRVIVVSVSSNFSSRLDEKGYPIHGRSDITFRTDRVLSRADWQGMTGMN